jgi:hypothetical protein
MSETSDSSIGSGDLCVFPMFSDVLVECLGSERGQTKIAVIMATNAMSR